MKWKDMFAQRVDYRVERRRLQGWRLEESGVQPGPRGGRDDRLLAKRRKVLRNEVGDLMPEPSHRLEIEVERRSFDAWHYVGRIKMAE
jgi:hypothetical protein